MKVALAKTAAGHIVPATEDDRLKTRAWKPGEVVTVKFSKPRNMDHHRKFMACVHFVSSHHPDYRCYADLTPLLEVLKKVTGHVRTWTIQSTGEIVEQTKSIAFDELDEGEFIAWAAKAKPFLVELMEQFSEQTKRRYGEEIDSWTHWCLN